MMLAKRMQAAAAGRKTLGFFDEATSTGASITIPAGPPAGAIAILAQLSENQGSTTIPTLVTPAGWTNITGLGDTATFDHVISSNDRGIRVAVCVKILDADDEGDSISGMNDDVDRKVLACSFPTSARRRSWRMTRTATSGGMATRPQM